MERAFAYGLWVQPTHLGQLFQALRQDAPALAMALGAIAGAAVYFGLPREPWWGWGLLPLGAGLVLAGVLGGSWRAFGWFAAAGGVFFLLAQGQVARAGAESFNWAQAARKPHWVVGRLAEVREREAPAVEEGGRRAPERVTLVLRDVEVYQLPGSGGIREVRAGGFKRQAEGLAPGDGVAVPLVMAAPAGPRYWGERDYRIWRYLHRDTVSGHARGTLEATEMAPRPAAGWRGRAMARVEAAREGVITGTRGMAEGVLGALLVGEQREIPPELREAYRVTGLTHLLAISGMQLTLVGGGAFLFIRRVAACVPGLALRVNIKAFAAVAGLLAAGGYTLLAGTGVGVVRAFIMVALVMLAALAGRLRSGLRAWAVAVLLILAISPALVLSAGFQLSVAAVGALIVWGLTESLPRGAAGWVRALALSSIVAGAATAPLVVWNFQQFSAVGLLANMVAVPVIGMATYVGMAALALWPVGLQGPALALMGLMVEGVNRWAVFLADFQGDVQVDAAWWPLVAALGLATVAAVVMRRPWAVAVCVAGGALLAYGLVRLAPAVEVSIMEGGEFAVVRGEGGYVVGWDESGGKLGFLAKRAGFKVTGEGSGAPTVADPALMPVTRLERFAWAVKRGGAWTVEPVRCGRPWQAIDEACRRDGPAEEEEEE